MKIVCIGGGPAGLYFGLLMKLQDPAHEIVVVERNRPYDTFGWGVVFSDATVGNLREADPVSAQQIAAEFSHWDDIDVHFKGRSIRTTGHGFIGIGRKRLLNILQARCEAVGVQLVFETNVTDDQAIARQYGADLVIASDGINSPVRTRYAETFGPDIDTRKCRFVWLGTKKVFDAFTFLFVPTEHGWFAAHAYRFENGLSTFIVETPDDCWRKSGLEGMSQEDGIAFCERLFAPWLDGEPLICNATHLRGSAVWIRFPRVICERWVHWSQLEGRDVPVVLMGDAAHTAHFSIGSGTKLALEDAIELARSLKTAGGDLRAGLAHYQDVRSVEVLKIQNAARNSTEWFENVERYAGLEPEQFAYSLLTRSQRISHENLRLRDPAWVAGYERWIAERAGVAVAADQPAPLPMLTPYTVRGLTLKNRVIVSPTLLQAAGDDGVPGDFHRVHLGSRALSGASLVMMEMTAVSPEARMTRADTGLWNDTQQAALAGIADFIHRHGAAKFGLQLGHAGRRGALQAGWDPAEPADAKPWPLLAASALAYRDGVSATPRAMTRADMDAVRDAFVAATRRAAEAAVDWLELQAGHGFLLSTFLSPLTNQRDDEHGGTLANRLRFPLEVFTAMRAAWPQDRPMSVRLSATDWAPGGTTVDEAIEIARAFHDAGADVIDVSSGEVTPAQRPVYGRLYQTPLADRVRNEGRVPTIAVGAITEADQVNGVIASGRADLCAIGRPFLSDASWLHRELVRLDRGGVDWHPALEPARVQFEKVLARPATTA
jgi:anthraniloyl-CoA monooxygenase